MKLIYILLLFFSVSCYSQEYELDVFVYGDITLETISDIESDIDALNKATPFTFNVQTITATYTSVQLLAYDNFDPWKMRVYIKMLSLTATLHKPNPNRITVIYLENNQGINGLAITPENEKNRKFDRELYSTVFVGRSMLGTPRVLIHEIGHLFGLGHVDDKENYMMPSGQGYKFTRQQRWKMMTHSSNLRDYRK